MLLIFGNSLSSTLRRYFKEAAAQGRDSFQILPASIGNFRSSESFSELFYRDGAVGAYEDNLRRLQGQPVTIIQSMAAPVGDHAMQLLLSARTLKRYGAGSITVAMPFAAFARQDRQFAGRFCSVAADDFPFLLKAAGVDRVMTIEAHSRAAEKFYTDHFGVNNVAFLSSTALFAADLKENCSGDIVIGAPDGADKPGDAGQRRAQDLACAFWNVSSLRTNEERKKLFRIAKGHVGVNQTKILSFDGDVRGKDCVLVDDMTDSGGTILNAAHTLKENGAKSVRAYLTHGLFNAKALARILSATEKDGSFAVDHLVVTDTVPGQERKVTTAQKIYPGVKDRVTVLSVAPLLERAVLHKREQRNGL